MSTAPFLKMNGLGNEIIVADMRGRADRVTPAAAVAINADPATKFDQIMAIHDPRTPGTFSYIEILNSDGSLAQACGNGMRCVVQALSAETGEKSFVFETLAGILTGDERADGLIAVDMGKPRIELGRNPAGRGILRHHRHRAADRADRRAGAAHAVGRLDGQSACDVLGRGRCLGLRARPLRAAARKPSAVSRALPISRSPRSWRPTTSSCAPGSAAPG